MSSGCFQLFKPSSGFTCVNVSHFIFSSPPPPFSVFCTGGDHVLLLLLVMCSGGAVGDGMVGEKSTHLSGKHEAENKGHAWGLMLTRTYLLNHYGVCKQFYIRNNDLFLFGWLFFNLTLVCSVILMFFSVMLILLYPSPQSWSPEPEWPQDCAQTICVQREGCSTTSAAPHPGLTVNAG